MKRNDLRAFIAFALIPLLLLPQGAALAGFAIPGFTRPGGPSLAPPLPVALPIESGILPEGVTLDRSKPNHLEVNQSRDKVVIRWESFDIGSDASTHFNQQGNANWVALNRIADTGVPSQIFGRLTADGKLYLINKNGILFGAGSQVNLHSLVATSLDPVDEQALLDGQTIQLQGTGSEGSILNEGTIQTKQGGQVIMVAPQVANAGNIDAEAGAVVMMGSSDASLGTPEEIALGTKIVNNSGEGLAVNARVYDEEKQDYRTGRITSDSGFVGVWGNVVRQDGVVRTVTTIQKGGKIMLLGKERVTTGLESETFAPISCAADTMNEKGTHGAGSIIVGADVIEHNGRIEANSGSVSMAGRDGATAAERIYLASGSEINVRGVLFDQTASQDVVSAQLNSNELRDDPLQKGGVLQGISVTFHAVEGSSIGETSGDLVKENVTALESNTEGGQVSLRAKEIILRDGAVIDVSGGAIHSSGDALSTTKLLSGNSIYTLEDAPSSLSYDKILGSFEKVYAKHGQTETFTGFYTGGANSVGNYVGAYTQGKDAGTLTLLAERLVLDGTIKANAFNGRFQTGTGELTDDYGYSVSRGRTKAVGGVLEIGEMGDELSETNLSLLPEARDHITGEIVIRDEVEKLSTSFDVDTPFPVEREGKTLISDSLLNESGAQRISLRSNTRVTIEKHATITLLPGGVNTADQIPLAGGILDIQAREILHQGTIRAPGGKVSFTTWDTVASLDQDPDQAGLQESFTGYTPGIYLDEGSVISVAGEEVDNWAAAALGRDLRFSANLDGGEIVLQDQTWFAEYGGNYLGTPVEGKTTRQGVIVRDGAVLDVSGGYMIGADSTVNGGNAGSLTMKGANLVLDGELRGYGYLGKKGGQITLHADSLAIEHEDEPWAPELDEQFAYGDLLDKEPGAPGYSLADNRLAETGFTRIGLKSRESVTVPAGVELSPSRIKRTAPAPGSLSLTASNQVSGEQGLSASGELLAVEDYRIGSSSLTITTNSKVTSIDDTVTGTESTLTVEKGASLSAAPGGSVSLTAPAVSVAGALSAPGGTISLEATRRNLVLAEGARLSAAGYLVPHATSMFKGLPVGATPHDAGTVSLSAESGSIIMDTSASIDLSGSGRAANLYLGTDGRIVSVAEAGSPGSLQVAYGDKLLNGDGEVVGVADLDITVDRFLPGLPGASVMLTKTSTSDPFTLTAGEIESLQGAGFDALGFASLVRIDLSGPLDLDVGRKLTLDAPVIRGDGNSAHLAADWIVLANSYWPSGQSGTAGEGGLSPELIMRADWIDIEGDLALQGFDTVSLLAQKDMRLQETIYKREGISGYQWAGRLSVGKDLVLAGDRIYPVKVESNSGLQDMFMYSHFSLSAPGGKMTIMPGSGTTSGPIYSAGGKITVTARDLEHYGVLAAPMGSIDLDVDGRIYLAPGSLLSVRGDAAVRYGLLAEDLQIWQIYDRNNPDFTNALNYLAVEGAPEKSVTLLADEVVIRQGAVIDTSAGGSVYGMRFIGSSSGTINPFEPPSDMGLARRYVVVPGLNLPGETVVVTTGTDMLPAGEYSVVPDDLRDEYAFLPGAVVLYDLGDELSGNWAQTPSGMFTEQGYAVVGGYRSTAGSGIGSPRTYGFAARLAADVAREGSFPKRSFTSGRSGDLILTAPTTIVDGTILGRTVEGFAGGLFSVSGAASALVSSRISLDESFSFTDEIPEHLLSSSNVFAGAISNTGIGEVRIGDAGVTKTTTVADGVEMIADSITLAASDQVTVGAGATVRATAENGFVSLLAPEGTVEIGQESEVYAAKEVIVEAGNLDLAGRISVGGSTLKLRSNQIRIVDSEYGPVSGGIILYEDLRNLDGFDTIELTAAQGIEFLGNAGSVVELVVPEKLVLATTKISGTADTVLSSGMIGIKGIGSGLTALSADEPSGSITFAAVDITVGPNALVVDGFDQVTLLAASDIAFEGVGSLQTRGDLTLTSARVTNAPTITQKADGTLEYTTGDFLVQAGPSASRELAFLTNGGTPRKTTLPGGILEFRGQDISMAGMIDLESANIVLQAENTISILDGGSIRSLGGAYAPGGTVALISLNGNVVLNPNSLIDISAGAQGDAGNIVLNAVQGAVSLHGQFRGGADSTGQAGSLAVDTGTLSSFADLSATLSGSGIDKEVAVRVRKGDLTISSGIKAESLTLSADGKDGDGGSITIQADDQGVSPFIDASGVEGGIVRILAGRNLNFVSGTIDASGETDGGSVLLGTGTGWLTFGEDAEVDVSGGSGDGGTAHFRAERTVDNADMKMTLDGNVFGAANALAEGYKIYNDQAVLNTNSYRTEAQNFMNSVAKPAGYTTLPGIEIRNAVDLTVATAWDLSSWNFGTAADPVPGVLTLRAGNNLNINADLSSRRVGSTQSLEYTQNLQKNPKLDSWMINLAAGSDLSAADFLSVNVRPATVTGSNFNIKANAGVYTESAPLSFASGGDTVVDYSGVTASRYWMSFLSPVGLGTFDGDIRGYAGNKLDLGKGGVIISGTGDIALRAGSAVLSSASGKGAILTTGFRNIPEVLAGIDPELVASYQTDIIKQSQYHWWMYGDGGDIVLDVEGDISGTVDLDRWAAAYSELDLGVSTLPSTSWPDIFQGADSVEKYWLAKYATPMTVVNPNNPAPLNTTLVKDKTAVGVIAMAGGDVSITAGGDALLQAGTFGHNGEKLSIVAAGDLDGLFMARTGTADLTTLGNYGATASVQHRYLETESAALRLTAMGNIKLDGVINPSLTQARICRYVPGASSVSIVAAQGDVILSGNLPKYSGVQLFPSELSRLFPSDVTITAGRDINAGTMVLAPAEDGSLVLEAGRDVKGSFIMADTAPSTMYATLLPSTGTLAMSAFTNLLTAGYADLIHDADPDPVSITAGRDVTGTFTFPKQAWIKAGRDIKDFFYTVQNLKDTDVSMLMAGRNIIPTTGTTQTSKGILQYGPGTLVVQAGNNINLGTSRGIQSLGNSGTGSGDARPKLPDASAILLIAAGYAKEFEPAEVSTLFLNTEWDGETGDGEPLWKQKLFEAAKASEGTGQLAEEADSLQEIGLLFTEYRTVDPGKAQGYLDKARTLLADFFGDSATADAYPDGGTISMEKSRILSRDDGGDIYMLARGNVVVGRSNIQLPGATTVAGSDSSSLGIFTERRGGIKIFAERDVDVFESRIMSMFGGDIAIWSDHGNVNAGKGSRTTVSSPVSADGEFKPPVMGSGVRTSTYDPDGPEGPKKAPKQGDAYVFAPEGVIDAGEAGISARNIYLGATQVLNAQNIQASGVSVGAPVQVSGAANVGALSGSSSLADATKMIENAAGLAARERAEQMARPPQFIAQLLDVRVVNYME